MSREKDIIQYTDVLDVSDVALFGSHKGCENLLNSEYMSDFLSRPENRKKIYDACAIVGDFHFDISFHALLSYQGGASKRARFYFSIDSKIKDDNKVLVSIRRHGEEKPALSFEAPREEEAFKRKAREILRQSQIDNPPPYLGKDCLKYLLVRYPFWCEDEMARLRGEVTRITQYKQPCIADTLQREK